MTIKMPLKLEPVRPITEDVETPYSICGNCQYIGKRSEFSDGSCCKCRNRPQGNLIWPGLNAWDILSDVIVCWNEERASLAVLACASYWETERRQLLEAGLKWCNLDSDDPDAFRDPTEIQKILDQTTNSTAERKLFKDIFGQTFEEMLTKAWPDDCDTINNHKNVMQEWRNRIIHRGERVSDHDANQALEAALDFVPLCWAVFSHLWNHFINAPMLRGVAGKDGG